jgi:hypothetical protein
MVNLAYDFSRKINTDFDVCSTVSEANPLKPNQKKELLIPLFFDFCSKFDSKITVENFFENVENYSKWPKTTK